MGNISNLESPVLPEYVLVVEAPSHCFSIVNFKLVIYSFLNPLTANSLQEPSYTLFILGDCARALCPGTKEDIV